MASGLAAALVARILLRAQARGYRRGAVRSAQSSLDAAWKPRFRLLGARIGPGLLVASAIFAVGHVIATPNPDRLSVFFPALLFGWLRTRTGGIGAGVLFHAACNLCSAYLARGYGFVD